MMKARFIPKTTMTCAILSLSWGCSGHDWLGEMVHGHSSRPFVSSIASTEGDLNDVMGDSDVGQRLSLLDEGAESRGITKSSRTLTGSVTFKKSGLFEREFLYGFDLQYSSGADSQLSLIPQSQAIGHVPAFFRRLGNELQLLANQTRLFESDVNHPELLLATYEIIAENDDSLTVRFSHGGLVINEVINGKGSDAPKQMWIRSLEYIEEGNYLLQESALLLKDGSVQTFMESLFPRSNLVPDTYIGMQADAEKEPLAERYRFLSSEKVYVPSVIDGHTVRTETSFANRFNLGETGTIDWYVTPNIPDKFLPVVKSGLEGWNRYFEPQLGRKVMQFKGRLPAGIKLGDPRYNVINFDTVAEAGAAYESQAADPLTGIQSHSMIYLPYAWYNIGVSLWKKRIDTTALPTRESYLKAVSPKSPETLLGPHARVLRCMRSAEDFMLPPAKVMEAMRHYKVTTPSSIDEFGMRLMLSTLFHEVGHSLGLAHNFKGSLSFDGTKNAGHDNPTSWSVMDYNFFQSEMELFGELGASSGPILEYDRQIISQLYHKGAEVSESDPVVPACEDSEADTTKDGVDPLCNRYDSENDPSLGVAHSYNNVVAAGGALGVEGKTLSESMAELKAIVHDKFSSAEKIPDAEKLESELKDLSSRLEQLIAYYVVSGGQAVRGNLVNNSKSLRIFADEVKLDDEAAFRSRYIDTLKAATSWRALPEVPAAALNAVIEETKAAIISNTAIGKEEAVRAVLADKAEKFLIDSLSLKVTVALMKLRASVYDTLRFKADEPFAFSLGNGKDPVNLEELAVSILRSGVTMQLAGSSDEIALYQSERLAAAATLVSFKGVSTGYDEAVTELNGFVALGKRTGNSKLVQLTREVLAALEKSEP